MSQNFEQAEAAALEALREAGEAAARAARMPKAWGAMADWKRQAAAALMRLGTAAAFQAAARRKPRPTLAEVEDAGATAALEALEAQHGDPCAALEAATLRRENESARQGGTDLALVASAGRALDRMTGQAAPAADGEGTADLAGLRSAAPQQDRRNRLDLADTAADPLPPPVRAALEKGFPGSKRRSVRVALTAALAQGTAPDLADWLGDPVPTVQKARQRGVKALRALILADDAATLAALAALVDTDGSAARHMVPTLADLIAQPPVPLYRKPDTPGGMGRALRTRTRSQVKALRADLEARRVTVTTAPAAA